MNQSLEKYLSSKKFQVLNGEHKFANLFFAKFFVDGLVSDLPKFHGAGLENVFMEIKGDYCKWVPDIDAFSKAAHKFFERLKSDPSYVEKTNRNLFASIDKVNLYSSELLSTDFSNKSNSELASCCDKYYSLLRDMICLGFFPVIMEIREPLFTDFLTDLANRKKEELKANISVAEAVAVLSSFQGETQTQKEQIELMKLALRAQKGEDIQDALKQHTSAFCWLAYGFSGPATSKQDFQEALLSLANEDLADKIKEFQKRDESLANSITSFEEKLGLTHEEKRFFAIARDFVKGKALRKEAMSLAAYAFESLYREIAKRLNISLLQARFLLLEELKEALNGKPLAKYDLNKRTQFVVFGAFQGGKIHVVATGKEAEQFTSLVTEEKNDSNIRELRGTCACTGKVRGIVKIVQHPRDIAKMEKGDILVSYATTPDLVPAMRLARAIVTDVGGLTSHAAIVGRELNVPCVIGTKIATKVFRDGEKIEVDAINGVVKKIK